MAVESRTRRTWDQSAESGPLLSVRDLHVHYLSPRGPVRAVEGVSFDIARGEVLGLAGESGCGKSTVAQAVLRILQPPAVITGGEVRFGDRDVLDMNDEELAAFRWRDVSMVFQSAMNALNPVITIGEQIVDAILAHGAMGKREARGRLSCSTSSASSGRGWTPTRTSSPAGCGSGR